MASKTSFHVCMRRIWIVLLIAVFCIAPSIGLKTVQAADKDTIQDGDIVRFGSYPQTKVTDSTLITKLNAVSKSWSAYPYYSKNTNYTESQTIPTKKDKTMMEYSDFEYSGKKYRAVKIHKYRPIDVLKTPDSEYKQANNGYVKETVYYFEYEPIRWIVLDKSSGLLLAYRVLDAQPLNAYYQIANSKAMSAVNDRAYASNYYYSTVRHWLNADSNYDADYGNFNFYDTAFSATEKKAMKTNTYAISDGGSAAAAVDYVFLLNYSDGYNYRSEFTSAYNTDYAEAQGMSKRGGSEGTPWYLSTFTNYTNVYYAQDQAVKTNSSSAYFSVITSTQTGIRPAIKVDLSNSSVIGPFKVYTSTDSATDNLYLDWYYTYPGALSYTVYRWPASSSSSSATPIATLSSSATYYKDTTAEAGMSYTYQVAVTLAEGEQKSSFTTIAYHLPKPVISSITRDITTGYPVIYWGCVSGASSYEIYRSPYGSGGALQKIASVDASSSSTQSYTDKNATLGQRYYYAVKAISEKSSTYNSVLSASKLGKCTLAKPTGVTQTDTSDGMPILSWDMVPGAYGYRLQYKKTSDSEWTEEITSATSITINNATAGQSYNYRLSAVWSSDSKDKMFESAQASGTFTCAPRPEFSKQPEDFIVFANQTQIFITVTSSGKEPTFVWWFYRPAVTNEGSSLHKYETELSGKGNISSNSYMYSMIPGPKEDGALYYVVAIDKFGRSTRSNTGQIIVLSQPQDTTAGAGNVAKFSVSTNFPERVASYQWQSKKPGSTEWVNSGQSGAKTATLSVATNAGLNGYQFRCIVTHKNGKTATSYAAELTVVPKITKQPTNTKVSAGETAKFTVAASGKEPLSYQWQSRQNSSASWTNSGQSGARTATLSVATNAGLHGWQFRCVITDGNGKKSYSNAATLTIVPKITKQPTDVTTTVGATAKYSITATGKETLRYQWQSRKDASSAWANSGQSGAKTATLSVAAKAGIDGWQFRCVVTDANGQKAESEVATLFVKTDTPKITKQPVNASVTAGTTAKFTVTAICTKSLTYQWQSRKNSSATWVNSGQSGAKTATLSVATNAGLNGYQFRCIVTAANGKTATSSVVTLNIIPKITKQPANTSVKAGNKATFTISATGTGTLKYQWQSRKNSSAEWVNSGQSGAKTATLTVSTNAGLNGYQFRCVVTDANGQKAYSNEAILTVTK